MKAVDTARQWWRVGRRRTRQQSGSESERLGRAAAPDAPSADIAPSVLALLASAVVLCAVVGVVLTQSSDRRFAMERHAALQRALDGFHTAFGDVERFDRGQLRLIERRSGLKDLRFGPDPALGDGREIQSWQDARGRIVGWFSWAPDRGFIVAMDWLWALAGVAGLALGLGAVIVRRKVRRLVRALARSAEAARKLENEDALTGLPNQRLMLESLDRRLTEWAGQRRGQVAFAVLDLEGIHQLTEAVGRNGSDAVIRTVAERLRAALPDGALLGRLEEDEFAVIAAGVDADPGAMVVERLRAALSAPVPVGASGAEQPWRIGAAIGLVQAPEDGTTGEELAHRATLALRTAKREGRKGEGYGVVRRFVPQIETEDSDRRFLLRELKSAICAQSFELQYQPIVAAAGSAIVGVEALLRWTHPVRGPIAPATFIPLAEQCGLMKELGEFVLRRALADAARWPALFVAVNLSPLQIRDPHIVELVGGVIAQAGIEPSRVVLEMTEGILIDDPSDTLSRLAALRELGVGLALDDFGTGYSSLSYLQRFPFSRLKIDRAFVAALDGAGNAGAIIHSIVALGHALGMIVLAEGVETDQQRVLLRLAGCDEMQGFLFARPSPAPAIENILAGQAVPAAATARSAASAS